MDTSIPVAPPAWTFNWSFQSIAAAYGDGRITRNEWLGYRVIWRYSAPRFSDLVPDSECPRVRDAWHQIDIRDSFERIRRTRSTYPTEAE